MSAVLLDYGRVLRERWRWVVWGALLAVGAAVVVLLLAPPLYRSTATVFIRTPGDVSRAVDGGDSYAQHRAGNYVELADSTDLAARVVGDLGIDLAPETLAGRTTATNRPGTVLIDVAVDAPTAGEAQRTLTVFLPEYAAAVHALETVTGSVVPRAELVVVNDPSLPTRVSFWGTPPLAVLLGACLVGMLLGATGAVLRSIFDRSVRDPRDAARITGRPVLGTIGDWHAGTTIENARLIRRRLLSVMGDPDRGVIAVAEPAARSATAAAAVVLADALRVQGDSVILVDLDQDSWELTKLFGVQGLPGITDVLLGHAVVLEAVQASGNGPLLGAGSATDYPRDPIDLNAVLDIVVELREHYDWVVLACPSAVVADAIVGAVGTIVLVVRHGVTTEDELLDTSASLPAATTVAVIVDQVPEPSAVKVFRSGERTSAR
ncbi:Wzz/FepE/Etk N-terminal domain-containing protein [Rhodococcus tukisamuensis]|uniref:Capsular polysaccharide biosynthesis protein n=1 Tax=Rhodococcus tukisamuensis TaxID=168276 RepID=A0A1G7AMM2_9NOCA|nr:Wzz/FepE/Etk N-terminal domain-containing protein [Rhodococcus tukisamuensis]SDE15717.1 Capsular polysaccharide biosynthesis protein [Rhodococcus tukisamuensis]